jgi:hypothetical protein
VGAGRQAPECHLSSHRLNHVMRTNGKAVNDARPRILARAQAAMHMNMHDSLVDLNHFRLAKVVHPAATGPIGLGANSWRRLPRADALLTFVVPKHQPFCEESLRTSSCAWFPSATGTSARDTRCTKSWTPDAEIRVLAHACAAALANSYYWLVWLAGGRSP